MFKGKSIMAMSEDIAYMRGRADFLRHMHYVKEELLLKKRIPQTKVQGKNGRGEKRSAESSSSSSSGDTSGKFQALLQGLKETGAPPESIFPSLKDPRKIKELDESVYWTGNCISFVPRLIKYLINASDPDDKKTTGWEALRPKHWYTKEKFLNDFGYPLTKKESKMPLITAAPNPDKDDEMEEGVGPLRVTDQGIKVLFGAESGLGLMRHIPFNEFIHATVAMFHNFQRWIQNQGNARYVIIMPDKGKSSRWITYMMLLLIAQCGPELEWLPPFDVISTLPYYEEERAFHNYKITNTLRFAAEIYKINNDSNESAFHAVVFDDVLYTGEQMAQQNLPRARSFFQDLLLPGMEEDDAEKKLRGILHIHALVPFQTMKGIEEVVGSNKPGLIPHSVSEEFGYFLLHGRSSRSYLWHSPGDFKCYTALDKVKQAKEQLDTLSKAQALTSEQRRMQEFLNVVVSMGEWVDAYLTTGGGEMTYTESFRLNGFLLFTEHKIADSHSLLHVTILELACFQPDGLDRKFITQFTSDSGSYNAFVTAHEKPIRNILIGENSDSSSSSVSKK